MTDKNNPTPAKVQPDDVPVGLMFALLGALVAIVLVALIVLWQYFGSTTDKVVAKQSLAKPSRVLKRVLKKQQQKLEASGVTDEAKGKYRIPVAQAMQILVRNPSLIAPLPKPAAATPGAAPAKATPAPAGGSPAQPAPAGAAAPAKAPAAKAATPTKRGP